MSSTSLTPVVLAPHWTATLGDYFELTKPRIGLLVLVTVAAAAFLAHWQLPAGWLLAHTLVGTFLVAGSASAMNHWYERWSDGLMPRTASRPLPAGRVEEGAVLAFAVALLVAGLPYLALLVNVATAACGALTWLLYVAVYTPLKQRTTLNTPLGAVAGALPVLMGWTAAEGELNLRAGALFLVVFLWQFPHFMAIAWLFRKDYAGAGLQMLTVVDPTGRRAAVQAVLAAGALLAVSLIPAWQAYALAPRGAACYLLSAFVLGTGQLACSLWFLVRTDDTSARWLLRASLLYLPLLLVALVTIPLWGE